MKILLMQTYIICSIRANSKHVCIVPIFKSNTPANGRLHNSINQPRELRSMTEHGRVPAVHTQYVGARTRPKHALEIAIQTTVPLADHVRRRNMAVRLVSQRKLQGLGGLVESLRCPVLGLVVGQVVVQNLSRIFNDESTVWFDGVVGRYAVGV